jgi:hypothetical protein
VVAPVVRGGVVPRVFLRMMLRAARTRGGRFIERPDQRAARAVAQHLLVGHVRAAAHRLGRGVSDRLGDLARRLMPLVPFVARMSIMAARAVRFAMGRRMMSGMVRRRAVMRRRHVGEAVPRQTRQRRRGGRLVGRRRRSLSRGRGDGLRLVRHRLLGERGRAEHRQGCGRREEFQLSLDHLHHCASLRSKRGLGNGARRLIGSARLARITPGRH